LFKYRNPKRREETSSNDYLTGQLDEYQELTRYTKRSDRLPELEMNKKGTKKIEIEDLGTGTETTGQML